MAAGATVLICIHLFSLSRRGFAVTNLLLIAVWLLIAVALARRYRYLAGDEPAPRAPSRQMGAMAVDVAREAPSET
jgi:hypothetical protein